MPDYMIPAAIVELEQLPLTPTGKVDRRALPAPDWEQASAAAGYVAPRTPQEAALAEVWAEVLGISRIGVHDNFFTLGGDSLLVMQTVTRLRRVGITLLPRQLFAHQTIAELATTLDASTSPLDEQGIVSGPLLLSIGQSWLLRQGLATAQHPFWHLVRMFDLPPGVDAGALAQATALLLRHHDGLRSRFVATESGWQARIEPPGGRVPFVLIDLAHLPDSMLHAVIERQGVAVQRLISLATGPLLLIVVIDCGPTRSGRLLIAVHHLVADAVSMWILLDDLWRGYEQFRQGKSPQLPPKTTSVIRWAEQLHRYARSPELRAAADAWFSLPWNAIPPLPRDLPTSREAATPSLPQTLRLTLDYETTQRLLRTLAPHYQAQMEDALLAALLYGLAHWSSEQWFGVVWMDSMRRPLPGGEDLDVSRTVGWFAAGRYLILERPADSTPAAVLQATIEQTRRVPALHHGLYYQIGDDPLIKERLRSLEMYEIFFSYTGQVLTHDTPFVLKRSQEDCDVQESPGDRSLYVLECRPLIVQGQLNVVWVYNQQLHHRATIERLGQDFLAALRAMLPPSAYSAPDR